MALAVVDRMNRAAPHDALGRPIKPGMVITYGAASGRRSVLEIGVVRGWKDMGEDVERWYRFHLSVDRLDETTDYDHIPDERWASSGGRPVRRYRIHVLKATSLKKLEHVTLTGLVESDLAALFQIGGRVLECDLVAERAGATWTYTARYQRWDLQGTDGPNYGMVYTERLGLDRGIIKARTFHHEKSFSDVASAKAWVEEATAFPDPLPPLVADAQGSKL